jgi:CPA2 family monovalent cation:H+ antiporter-2
VTSLACLAYSDGMASEFGGQGLSDTLTILGAAGIVIPAFARLKISPVIGFIIVGMVAGPYGLGGYTDDQPWLQAITINDPEAIEPFAEFGIILLLFSIGLELSFRRLVAMRRMVFGIGAAELALGAMLIGGGLLLFGEPASSAIPLGIALAMSSTALVLPIAGTTTPVGKAAFAMLLFEDLALVPLLFLLGSAGAGSDSLLEVLWKGVAVIVAMLVAGRFLLPPLFAQAARTKSPELFLAVSLLVVILASLATGAVGLSPIVGALVAGLLIAETEYHNEVEVVTAPFRGLALGIFLITVGMRIDFRTIAAMWPELLFALVSVLLVKTVVTALLLRFSGSRPGTAAETGLLMASPSETTLILLGAAAAAGAISADTASFWQIVTAVGLTVTPLLALLGRLAGKSVDREAAETPPAGVGKDRTVIFGFGRVGRMVADMLTEHNRPYLAIENDIDSVTAAREAGYSVMFGDVSRPELVDKLELGHAAALVLTMDDPVLVAKLTRRVRGWCPDLAIIARARDPHHAAILYKAGVTDAVPETLEASLQLSEAVLVDTGMPMGPVIASIHEKRAQLRAEIMAQAELAEEPALGRRRLRDAKPGA